MTRPAAAHRSPPVPRAAGSAADGRVWGRRLGRSRSGHPSWPQPGVPAPSGVMCAREAVRVAVVPAVPACHPTQGAAGGTLLTLTHPSHRPVPRGHGCPSVGCIPAVMCPPTPWTIRDPPPGLSAAPRQRQGRGPTTPPAAAPALLLAQVRPVSVRSFNPAVVHLGRGAGLSAAQTSHFLTALPGAGPSRAPRARLLAP